MRYTVSGLVLIGVLLSGCSDDDAPAGPTVEPTPTPGAAPEAPPEAEPPPAPEPAAPVGPDACELVDTAAAERVVGTALARRGDPGPLCNLHGREAGSLARVVVQVTPDAARVYPHERDLLQPDRDVTGVGDEAFKSGNIVGARVGDHYLSVTVMPHTLRRIPDDDIIAIARTAAERLAAR